VDSLRQAGVILEQNVDERPEIVSGPQLEYPLSAREEHITGRVIIQAIIGRDGRAEPPSLGVRRNLDWRLDRAALDYMEQASFKPGKVHGEIVRTLVNIPVDFIIRGKY
jgi:TonB family protein